MMEDRTKPKIFTQESVATPKHDEMLLIFARGTESLAKIMVDKIKLACAFENSLLKNVKVRIYREGDTLYKSCKVNYFNKNYIYQEKYGLPEVVLKNPLEMDCIKEIAVDPKSLSYEWLPEKALMNGSFYIGSIDLLVKVDFKPFYNLYSLDGELVWEKYETDLGERTFFLLFEFKPTILSFSETIRQVNVYKSFSPKSYPTYPLVVTYSDITKFKPIFESQGIDLIQLKNEP